MRFWEVEFLFYLNDDSNFTVPLLNNNNNNNTFVYFQNLHCSIFLQRCKLSHTRIYRSFSHVEKVYWRRNIGDIYMLLSTVADLLLFGLSRIVEVTFVLSELCTSVESTTYTLTSICLGTRNILF